MMINSLKIFKDLQQNLSFLEKLLVVWGLAWGFLGLALYFLGLVSLFYQGIVIGLWIIFLLLALYLCRKIKLSQSWTVFFKNFRANLKKDKLFFLVLALFFIFSLINLFAALAPELGYDALWYHLTLPKIYLLTHTIRFLPGQALYYSVMPRLVEIFYAVALSFDSWGILAKIVHYSFGLAWAVGIYVLLRQFLARRTSLLMTLAAYGTIIVSWHSQTAYIDLAVAFFALMAMWALLRFLKTENELFLTLGAVFMGFNLASKIFGIIIFAILLGLILCKIGFKQAIKFAAISLAIALPFYLQAYLATGNPIYPVFSINLGLDTAGFPSLKDWYLLGWPRSLPALFWSTIIQRFAPVFGLIFILPFIKGWSKMLLFLLVLLAFFILWSMIPNQEVRYFMMILPILALLTGWVIEKINSSFFKPLLLGLILIPFFFNLYLIVKDYKKSTKVVLARESKMDYLKSNLPLSLNYYDAQGWFAQNIKQDEKVLTVQVGNLFYLNFPFWDWSFIADRDSYFQSAEYLANRLKKDGYDYVLLGKLDIVEWTSMPPDALSQYFELIYQYENLRLYRIK